MAIFIYGTLRDPVLLARLLGTAPENVHPASLPDHMVLRWRDEPFPYLKHMAGHTATGVLLVDPTPEQIARLDAYELPFDYALHPVEVLVDGQPRAAQAYFPGDSVIPSDIPWDMTEWDAAVGDLSREAALEIGAYDPPLTGDALKSQFDMILRRAAARLRACATTVPDKMRRSVTADDFDVVSRGPLHGNFFKAGALQLQHRTFQNTQSDILTREIFIGTDAAIVLPYDPVSDNLLLVEQIRMGPLVRGAPNPWSLEPIAGMIDARETPEQAGLREAEEEAGLTGIRLEKMFSFYATPGNATDYFYCYIGLCDLPDMHTYTGGLEEESEDLRLHILPFADAIALIETGEVNVGPLIAMLLWLDRHRARLRGLA